jgi:hypothetical protein
VGLRKFLFPDELSAPNFPHEQERWIKQSMGQQIQVALDDLAGSCMPHHFR